MIERMKTMRNPFKLSHLFRALVFMATIAGAVLLETGTLALLAALYGMMPFAYVAQLQVPYVGPYLTVIDGPLTQYAVAQVLASGLLGLAGAGVAILLGGWLLRRLFMAVCRGIMAAAMSVVRSPVATYRGIVRARTWLLAKVEYLQGESAKWKMTFNILKSPYSLLRTMGFSPQMAISFLVAGTAVGSGVVVNETVFAEKSFSRGDPGVYSAPLDTPVFAADQYNTLRLDLGTTSVGNITIENISLGTAYTGSALPSGESNVIYIGGIAASSNPTFNQTYLEVGTLIIDRWRCERLDISDSEIHTLIVRGNASDGQSISAVAGTPRDRGIGGGNRADDMKTSGGYYDMLKITSASSGVNGKVDVLKLSNLYSKGGACTIKYVKAGTMEITLNEIGGDESLNTKAFTIATSVIFKSFLNEGNVEVSMAVPPVQTMGS
jgi:hypothetical protein